MTTGDVTLALKYVEGKLPTVRYEFLYDASILYLEIYELLVKDYCFLGFREGNYREPRTVDKSVKFVSELVEPFMTCPYPERKVKSPYHTDYSELRPITRSDSYVLPPNEGLLINYKGQYFDLVYNNTNLPGENFRKLRQGLLRILYT